MEDHPVLEHPDRLLCMKTVNAPGLFGANTIVWFGSSIQGQYAVEAMDAKQPSTWYAYFGLGYDIQAGQSRFDLITSHTTKSDLLALGFIELGACNSI